MGHSTPPVRTHLRSATRNRRFRPQLEPLEDRALPSFAAPVAYNVGSQTISYVPNAAPIGVATADFNGDGKLDLAQVDTADNSVYILKGNGNGTFQSAVRYAIGEPPQGDVFVADFNGDGKLDLFLPAGGTSGNSFTTHPSILLGNGNGTFQSPLTSSSFGPSRGWAVSDFNGDGKPDLVSTNPNAGTVSVLLGNGNGTFAAAITSPQLFQYSRWVTAADFDGDGKIDLAIADGVGQGTATGTAELTILRGNGNGTFSLGHHYASPEVGSDNDTVNPEDVVALDVNGDGRLDVIESDYSYNINVFFGNGDGTFQNAVGIVTGEYPRSVHAADVDGDGRLDLIVTNVGINVGGAEFATDGAQPGSVAVLLGNGDGTFRSPSQFTPFAYPGWTAIGDFNGDGHPDLAVTRVSDGHSVNVMLNTPGVPFPSPPPPPITPTAQPYAVGSGYGSQPHVKVYNGDGSLRFSFYAYGVGFLGGVNVAMGDVTGDGVLDIITGAGAGAGPHVKVFDGVTGQEIRSFYAYDQGYSGGVFVAAGDLNGDGKAEIVTSAGMGNGDIRAFDAVTGAVLEAFLPYGADFLGGANVAVGDIDGNGSREIITGTNAGPTDVRAFAHGGVVIQSFLAYDPSFQLGVRVTAVTIAGGGVDIATAPGAGNAVVSLFDPRSGQPSVPVRTFAAFDFAGGITLAARDVDGDGIDDFIVGVRGSTGPHVQIFRGTDFATLESFFAFDPGFLGGVNVG